jgi:hypothetical protein
MAMLITGRDLADGTDFGLTAGRRVRVMRVAAGGRVHNGPLIALNYQSHLSLSILIFYLLSVSNVEIGVTKNLVLNDPTKIIGVTPNLPSGKTWYIKIRTRYASGGTPPQRDPRNQEHLPRAHGVK